MIEELRSLLAERDGDFLMGATLLRQIGEWVVLTTHHLDRHGDYVQIYAQRSAGGYLLTDDGHTFTDLVQSGCTLDDPECQEFLRETVLPFRVVLSGERLEVHASRDDLVWRMDDLRRAMLTAGRVMTRRLEFRVTPRACATAEASAGAVTSGAPETECDGCRMVREYGFGPTHRGEPNCRMGASIAAGGTQAHCTCAGCF